MCAALNQGHFGAEPGEELGKFDRHRATAQDNQRLGRPGQSQRFITREITDLFERRQGRLRDNRAGADDKISRGERCPSAERQGARVEEAGARPDEFEPAAGQLPRAVVGAILDDRVFAPHDRREFKADLRRPQTPGVRLPCQVQHIRRVEQGFGRHASTQNAKAAHLLAAFDDGCVQAGPGRRAGRRVTGAAAADDGEIEIEMCHAREDEAGRKAVN